MLVLLSFFCISVSQEGEYLCVHPSKDVSTGAVSGIGRMRRGNTRFDSESPECDGDDDSEQFYFSVWCGSSGGNGNNPEGQYGSHVYRHGTFSGYYAADQLYLCQRQS